MDIQAIVERLVRRYGANDPFEIADLCGINVLDRLPAKLRCELPANLNFCDF